MLPDEVLLGIFDICAGKNGGHKFSKRDVEAWQSLVHVCQRWRSVVFGSPRRLNLRLVFTNFTHARDTLDVWPALPLVFNASVYETKGEDDVAFVLERRDRLQAICLSFLVVWGSSLEDALAAMQGPFPELTDLRLNLNPECGRMPILPESFLGGSVPRLRFLRLKCIPFPGLPELLLSTSQLTTLYLEDIPHSGYFSPEAMATPLSTLINLRSLCLQFESYEFDWENRRLLPPTRSILPVLTSFEFKGVGEYLNDLVAGIEAPKLRKLNIYFLHQEFDLPQLIQFISDIPKLRTLEKGHVSFREDTATVVFSSQTYGHGVLVVDVFCEEPDYQLTSLKQVCASCLPPLFTLFTLEDLYIHGTPNSTNWKYEDYDPEDDPSWLGLLRSFPSVMNLYLSEEAAPCIMAVLEDFFDEGRTTVLPNLREIFSQCPWRPNQERHWEVLCRATVN